MKVCLATLDKGDKYDNWFIENVIFTIKHLFDKWIIDVDNDVRNFAEARNSIIQAAEAEGMDWIWFLDADETMFSTDVIKLRNFIDQDKDDLIVLPRINFVDGNGSIETVTTPDLQGKIFKLNQGYHFKGKVHETVFKGEEMANWHEKGTGYRAMDCPIYHYGWCKPMSEIIKKYWRFGERVNSEPYDKLHPLTGGKPYDF